MLLPGRSHAHERRQADGGHERNDGVRRHGKAFRPHVKLRQGRPGGGDTHKQAGRRRERGREPAAHTSGQRSTGPEGSPEGRQTHTVARARQKSRELVSHKHHARRRGPQGALRRRPRTPDRRNQPPQPRRRRRSRTRRPQQHHRNRPRRARPHRPSGGRPRAQRLG